jgi:GNAT superfamily N-acetyltransferase
MLAGMTAGDEREGYAGFVVRPTTGDDWRDIRALRLEMLADTPTAYAETLDSALRQGEAEWRMRGRRGTAGHGTALVAITDTGRWAGTMGGYLAAGGPLLVGVYVAPHFRGAGAGVTDALLAGVEDWARGEGDMLTLHVHEHNTRARRAYEKRGFVANGVTVPYVLDPSANEIEMTKRVT